MQMKKWTYLNKEITMESKKIGNSFGEKKMGVCFCQESETESEKSLKQAAHEINGLRGIKFLIEIREKELSREKDSVKFDYSQLNELIDFSIENLEKVYKLISQVYSVPEVKELLKEK